jgi:hypothetical protein
LSELDGHRPAQDILCCFMVVIDLDGGSRVVIDPQEHFNGQRLATPKDVYPALANCVADWQGIKTAEAVVSFQTQMARQAQAVAEAEHVRRLLEKDQHN